MEGYRRMCRLMRTGKLRFVGSPDESQAQPNDEGSQPILPLAMGWRCKEVPHQEWISFTVAASLAKIIAEHWYINTKQTEIARLNAKMAGELFAIYHSDDHTQEGMLTARQTIVDILKEHLINNRGTVKDAITTITGRVSGPHISQSKVRNNYIPDVEQNGLVNAQRHAMFASRGPAIPCTIMKNTVWKDFWQKCVNNAEAAPPVSKPTQELELADDYADIIRAMNEEDIVGLFEAVACTRPEQQRQYALASVFICISALCQGESATDEWVGERLKHLQKQGLNINIKEHVTAEIIDTYDELYPRDKLSNDKLCQTIVVMHAYLEEPDHLLLECMIQEAITAIISPVPSLAYVATKWPTLKWNITLKNEILTRKLEVLAYVCMFFIRNPICFVKPLKCPLRLYSDWSYVGMQLQKKLRGTERFCNYRTIVTVMNENKNTLDSLCEEIVRGKGPVDPIQSLAAMKLGTIQLDETWVYVTPTEMESRVVDLPGIEGQLVQPPTNNWDEQTLYDVTKPGKCIANEDIRAAWPAKFRNLPKYAYRIPISKIQQRIRDIPVALKEVLRAVHDTDRKTMLVKSHIKDGITHVEFQFERPLRENVRKALATLGVPLEHIPSEAPSVIHQAYRKRQVFVSPTNAAKS